MCTYGYGKLALARVWWPPFHFYSTRPPGPFHNPNRNLQIATLLEFRFLTRSHVKLKSKNTCHKVSLLTQAVSGFTEPRAVACAEDSNSQAIMTHICTLNSIYIDYGSKPPVNIIPIQLKEKNEHFKVWYTNNKLPIYLMEGWKKVSVLNGFKWNSAIN